MCCQPLPPPLSPPSAKLMIITLEEYGYQSRRGIRPTDLRLFHLSVTKSTIPPHPIDEDSKREEEDAFFLARSRTIGHISRTSSPESSASSFKFKPPCSEPEVVSKVFAFLLPGFRYE
ncbi:hypothetical protein Tco_0914598 [Tanacetum coccineum]